MPMIGFKINELCLSKIVHCIRACLIGRNIHVIGIRECTRLSSAFCGGLSQRTEPNLPCFGSTHIGVLDFGAAHEGEGCDREKN